MYATLSRRATVIATALLLLLLLTAGTAMRARHTVLDRPAVPTPQTGHGGGHPMFR